MKKRLLISVAFAALLGLGLSGVSTPALAASAQGKPVIGFQNQASLTAMALFSQPLSGGSERYVMVFASRGRLQTEPGAPLRDVGSVDVAVFEGNLQEGVVSFIASGHADVPDLVIDKQLSGAYLPPTTVTMEVGDLENGESTGETFALHVEVTWTGTGAVSVGHFVTHYRLPGFMELTRSNGKERVATAVANELTFMKPDGTQVNMSGATDENAGLSDTRFMDIVFMRQSEG